MVDSAGDVGEHNSVAEINGQPAISYYDFYDNTIGGDLKYARYDGISWQIETVDAVGRWQVVHLDRSDRWATRYQLFG
ncbi:MAG: hypothetical protein R2873_27555 [Caldilineaceae bacterium]